MSQLKFVNLSRIFLKDHPVLHEKWVQECISDNPKILGLGDELRLIDKERPQPRAGRLDLLLLDHEANRRYEVEIQLGATDESHIIRTIEYWDIEKKRYPQYDHCAVIIAEEITARFLNVIGLFNGTIPLIAIQLSAFQRDDEVSLVFTKVLDEMRRGLVDEDEEVRTTTTRADWEKSGSPETVALVDEILQLIRSFDPVVDLKYNQYYIGLTHDGQPNNFVQFIPLKKFLRIEPRLEQSEELRQKLESAGLDLMPYDKNWGRYRIRLTKQAFQEHRDVLGPLLKKAYDASL